MKTNTLGLLLLLCCFGVNAHVIEPNEESMTNWHEEGMWTEEDYEEREYLGFKIYIHLEALNEVPETIEAAYDSVVSDITFMRKRFMINAFDKLVEVEVKFLLSNLCVDDDHSTAFYNSDWDGWSDFRRKSIVYCNASDVLRFSSGQPGVTIHEIAHAFHDLLIDDGFDNATIIKYYDRLVESGEYDEAAHIWTSWESDREKVRPYYLTNHREYFAEVSEALFLRNDYEPFTFYDVYESKVFTDRCDDDEVADDIPWNCDTYPNSRYNPVWNLWWRASRPYENEVYWYYQTLDQDTNDTTSWIQSNRDDENKPPPVHFLQIPE